MAADQFRQDLYYRVNVVRLFLPPLRQRMEDVPLLVERFISKLNLRQGKCIQEVDPAVMAAFMSHAFPGNIRELENIIEHAFVLCQQGTITREHLPGFLSKTPVPCHDAAPDDPVKAAQITLISDALARNNFNRNAAAKDLGIHKSTLFRRIKKLGIKL
jgi:transcriptional regulator with PAS, ATPase and Fis domain